MRAEARGSSSRRVARRREAVTTTSVRMMTTSESRVAPPARWSRCRVGRWQIVRKVAQDRVISTVDPDARHAHKTGSRRQDGFKAHLGVEPDTRIITGCELTKAAGAQAADGAVGIELLERDETVEGPIEVLGDSAYGTGEALDQLNRAGHTPVIKPWPTRPAVLGGFELDDFIIDEQAGTATCPAGTTRQITSTRTVNFGAACRSCPFAA